MFPSAAGLFSGMPPLESVTALLSVFVSHNQGEAKGKRLINLCKVLVVVCLFLSYMCVTALGSSAVQGFKINQEDTNNKRTLAMYDISRAHFHGVPVRRVPVELPDEDKERLARENGPDLENLGLL